MDSPESQSWTPNRKQQALIDLLSVPPYPSMADAARKIDIQPQTARKWNMHPAFKDALARAYEENRKQIAETVQRKIVAAAESALAVKLGNLRTGSAHVRHLESTWLLERFLGKTAERIEHTGKDGGPMEQKVDLIAALDDLFNRPLPPRDVGESS